MKWLKQNGSVGWIGSLLCLLTVASLPAAALAYRATEYSTDHSWHDGSVVALDSQGQLVLASSANANYVGVVVKSDSDSVQVADEASSIPMLVSRQAGDIKAGERLGLSGLAGVAVKWQPGSPLLAVAKQAPKDWQSTDIVTADGQSGKASLALINVQLLKAGATAGQTDRSSYMSAVERTANQIAGHSVAVWQISLALVLGLAGIVLSVGLLFISSRESFFSIGRNPLAGNTIMSSLWKMSAVSVVILMISLTSAYLILRVGS
ncbi:MAG TPA: hypothetical protein VFK03_00650 [Candidatus Saccharimonadales bacterium]|nr:hypothetical protein [Candidatus Saccharimonadales bacterium]